MDYKKMFYQIELSNTGENRDDTGRAILTRIVEFLEENKNKKVAVFLHTSVVAIRKHNLQLLKSLESNKVKFYIPENCIHELQLLKTRSSLPVLRRKATNFLEVFGKSVSWSHYVMSENKYKLATQYNYNRGLFVFCEPAAASEFSKRFSSGDGFFVKNQILSYNPYTTARERICCCKTGDEVRRDCKNIIDGFGGETKKDLEQRRILTVYNFDNQKVGELDYNDFREDFIEGGEAKIYESPKFPGKVIKIYNVYPSEGLEKKLYRLHSLYKKYDCCAFPTEIVRLGRQCVGFLMDKIEGDTVDIAVSKCFDNIAEKNRLLLNLSTSLVEARINQLVAADLSPRNAIVRKDGRVVFIDVDSMEFAYYPGGSITPPYGHPGFNYRRDAFQRLRTLEETGFAYSVLLFWFTMGCKHPLHQCGVAMESLDWNTCKFPYDNSYDGKGIARKGTKPKPRYLDLWKDQPSSLRTGFVDIFANHKTYDIGEWLKILNLT